MCVLGNVGAYWLHELFICSKDRTKDEFMFMKDLNVSFWDNVFKEFK